MGDICAHLTVGVQEHTRHAIVEALAELFAGDETLRRSLPLGVDVCDADDLAAEVAATVDALIARLPSIRPDDVARVFEERTLWDTRPAPLEPLAQAEALERVDIDSVISMRLRLRATVAVRDGELTLVLPGRTLSLPAEARAAVEALVHGGSPIRVGDLPGLSGPAALVLSRDLIRAGVVVPETGTAAGR